MLLTLIIDNTSPHQLRKPLSIIPIPFVDGRTTISHTESQYPADTAIISTLNGIDPDKMLPFYTKASSRERMGNLYLSNLCCTYSLFQRTIVQLLPAFEATSAVEVRKFRTTAIPWAGILLGRSELPNSRRIPLTLVMETNVTSEAT